MPIPISLAEYFRKIKKILIPLFVSILFVSTPSFAQQTVDNASLQTWWHANHELNSESPVATEKVRRSTFYDVQVSTTAAATSLYDSFAYMTIPRSGKGKPGYDGEEDGAEFVSGEGDLTMSWSSFLYSQDVWVNVSLRSGTFGSVDEVTIRPTKLNFQKEKVDDNTVRIRVPYSANGYRFSVEFNSQLYTAYNDMGSNPSGLLTTQGGGNRRAIQVEPRNSLLIFAEPILTSGELTRTVPTAASGSIYYPEPGEVRNLNNVTQDIIYFRPGTYHMGWNHHTVFPENSNVKWVYIAPGAYVKGAFRFKNPTNGLFKVTGYGVLSGEQYIYEADTSDGYNHMNQSKSDCHTSCVKMLQFESGSGQQHLDLQGVTINEPPYHSFVVYGIERTFAMRVNNYKQVGSWVWQTDGIELYAGSRMNNTFFHANDDVLKMYHSNVNVDNTVIWKGENGPVIQWGWDNHRNLDNIVINNTDVIHNRHYWRDVKGNTCLINASPHYAGAGSNGANFLRGITIENTRVEGMINCAIRIYALISIGDNAIKIKNLHIDKWSDLDAGSHVNHFQKVGDVFIGTNALSIENFRVGNEYVTTESNNVGATQLGRFDFKLSNWRAFKSVADCTAQTITFPTIADQPLGSSVMLGATADSGLAVTYSVSGGEAEIVDGNTLTIGNTSGLVTVTALQAGTEGEDGYCPTSISQQFFAGERPPEPMWIGATFSDWALQPMTYNATNKLFEYVVQLNAGDYQMKFADTNNWMGDDWGGGSGLQSTVMLATGKPNSNSLFTIAENAEYTISFDRANLSYSISNGDVIDPCDEQLIDIAPIANQQIGSTVALSGSANSALPLTWKIETGAPSGARISGANQLYVGDAAGPLTVTASQAGNAEYCPATASLTFDVIGDPIDPLDSVWIAGSFSDWTYVEMNIAEAGFTIDVPLTVGANELLFANNSDGSDITWGAANGLNGNATASDVPVTFEVDAEGNYSISFNPEQLSYEIEMVAVACMEQTINFASIGNQMANAVIALDASTSSGLDLTYSVVGGNAAIVNGNSVNVGDAIGTITVTATQAGNMTYCPASVSRAFMVLEFNQKGGFKAPLYWSPYEANIIPDAPLQESEWIENVNWIDANFKEYGYDMIATDGWIEQATQTNNNGYILKYNDNWSMTWHDMGNYLEDRGLKLGVYYNPFWITPAAANDSSKKVIGTNTPVGDLIDRNYDFPDSDLPGDRFGYMFGRSNEETLYWLQADHPDAEAYVKGYIDYFASAGMTYLRVDFLSWYEDGMDKGKLAGKPNRPREHYELMLKWMKEACDKHGIFLSLVMPHLKNESELEVKYGHMIRINEDAGKDAGWGRWSELDRGNRRSHWSQWANAVDGFTYWSKLSGRGKMILDGDFLRMNTFGNDDERKSAISLSLVAGGPVTISDRAGSIGNHAWLYQNEEMLALNKDGFVGKPLTNDPSQAEGYIWKGQMSNGDWILALFNRDNDSKSMSINFSDLGIAEAEVRDLWEHKDLGLMSAFSTVIPPRGVTVLRLKGGSCDLMQQSISFSAIPDKDITVDPRLFDINVTADSGLPVTLEIDGPATLDGARVSLTESTGTVTITASQPGNSEYCAAATVIQSFEVTGGSGGGDHQEAMYIGATFNSWRPSDEPMTFEAGVWVAKDVQIPAGTHELKFANTGDWTGMDWGHTEGLSGTASESTGGAPNIIFSAPTTGAYTITFNDVSLMYSIEGAAACEEACTTPGIIAGATYVITAKHSRKALDVSGASSDNGAAIHQWEYMGSANQEWRLEDAGNGFYKLISNHSNKALDVSEGSSADGAAVHQWEPLAVASQRWKLEVTDDGHYYIINSNSGKALAVSDASLENGGIASQITRNNSDNLLWNFKSI